MEILALILVPLVFPVIALAIILRQIRRRPMPDESFLQDKNDWGAQ